MNLGLDPIAVILAVVADMAIGMLWYSPFLFGNMWLKEMKMPKFEPKGGRKAMAFAVVSAAVTAIVLGLVLDWLGVTEVDRAIEVAFVLWLGFVATTASMDVIYEGKSLKLFVLMTSYKLLAMMAMAMVLTSWK
jgi:hypothetical protein